MIPWHQLRPENFGVGVLLAVPAQMLARYRTPASLRESVHAGMFRMMSLISVRKSAAEFFLFQKCVLLRGRSMRAMRPRRYHCCSAREFKHCCSFFRVVNIAIRDDGNRGRSTHFTNGSYSAAPS